MKLRSDGTPLSSADLDLNFQELYYTQSLESFSVASVNAIKLDDKYQFINITALAENIQILGDNVIPDGFRLVLRIAPLASYTISWTDIFYPVGVTLPSTLSQISYFMFIFNNYKKRWDVLGAKY